MDKAIKAISQHLSRIADALELLAGGAHVVSAPAAVLQLVESAVAPAAVLEAAPKTAKPDAWSEEEDKLLRENAPTTGAAGLAALLGRSQAAVYSRAAKFGLAVGNTRKAAPWSAEDRDYLRELYPAGMSYAALSALLGREVSKIKAYAGMLKLHRPAPVASAAPTPKVEAAPAPEPAALGGLEEWAASAQPAPVVPAVPKRAAQRVAPAKAPKEPAPEKPKKRSPKKFKKVGDELADLDSEVQVRVRQIAKAKAKQKDAPKSNKPGVAVSAEYIKKLPMNHPERVAYTQNGVRGWEQYMGKGGARA